MSGRCGGQSSDLPRRPISLHLVKLWMLRALKAIRLVDFSREIRERNIYASFRIRHYKGSPRVSGFAFTFGSSTDWIYLRSRLHL